MRNTLVILILTLALASACTSKSERVAKYKAKEPVVLLKVAFHTVIDYEQRLGILQYYESDTTLITLAGNMKLVQDSVLITRISTFRRTRR